ncbi:RhuM family protein [Acidithiobacillus sulfuriphilus]|uniref:RhuM family protein n=1 Tax=Acidithiobacillus sulfuriphilus TaxID=1867749 RepID=A0ACD5HRX7_9PROT
MPNSSRRGGQEVAREMEHYNLDMILALGFRVRSAVGVRFRRGATDKLEGGNIFCNTAALRSAE